MKKKQLLVIGAIIAASLPGCNNKDTADLRSSVFREVNEIERSRVIPEADNMLQEKPVTVTAFRAERSAGGIHDYFSEGPYWWPDSLNPDGPFVRHDGLRFPGRFTDHDKAMDRLARIVATTTSAYLVTGEEKYVNAAMTHLKAWFVDTATMMNPSFLYAQAIKGVCTGRGVGLIDAVPFIEVARAVSHLEKSPYSSDEDIFRIKSWFGQFLTWMTTHEYGIDEMNAENNHGSWWHAQAAQYAMLTGNASVIGMVMEHYKNILLPNQLTAKGTFPEELARTKPYSYTLFNTDAFATLTWILSDESFDMWNYSLPDGRSLAMAVDSMMPYITDISKWPYAKDVDNWENQPDARSFILMASIAQDKPEYFEVWKRLMAKDSSAFPSRWHILWFTTEDPLADVAYSNPVIPGYNPDPSICRAGDDYYVVTSSNEYFPALPVYHSRDLVNWKLLGHAIDRPSQISLDSVKSSGGIYAPTLRFHNGTFYLITTLAGVPQDGRARGNFVITATNPAGPWSDPVWIKDAPGIDPSLLFDDDGKVYYCGNRSPETKMWDKHRNIWVQEINPKTWELTGQRVDLLNGADYYRKGTLDGGIEEGVNNFEAPHIYKKDGTYYLVIANGGTFQNHAVSVWRSRNIFGPYEINPSNPVLTHRDLPPVYTVTSVGHADFVEDNNSQWWMVYHGRRPFGGEFHMLGRETFISPVDWSGEWPVTNPAGRAKMVGLHPGTKEKAEETEAIFRDDFGSGKLGAKWTFLRNPRTEWWSFTNGRLRMSLRPETVNENSNPSLVCIKLMHHGFEASAGMVFNAMKEGEQAGIVLIRDTESSLGLLRMIENGKQVLKVMKVAPGSRVPEVVTSSDVSSGEICLRVKGFGNGFHFSFSENGSDWKEIGGYVDGSFLALSGLGRFTGTCIGLYATSNGSGSNAFADFDWFEYRGTF